MQYIAGAHELRRARGPRRFRFGFIASSDNHSARPGTGYKEYARTRHDRAARRRRAPTRRACVAGEPEAPTLEPRRFDPSTMRGMGAFRIAETERQASFFLTGGLVAVHAEGRDARRHLERAPDEGGLRHERRAHPALVRPR